MASPRPSWFPPALLDDMVSDGAESFAGFAAGDVGQGPHDPDLVSVPDMKAMIVLPWRRSYRLGPRDASKSRTNHQVHRPREDPGPPTGDWATTAITVNRLEQEDQGVHAAPTIPGWLLRAMGRPR